MDKKVFAFIGSRSIAKTTYTFVHDIIIEMNKFLKIEYDIMTLNDLCIKPCRGCNSCFYRGDCTQKDDLLILKEKILSSDLFIIAAPVYMHGMPGEMKNIIDRLTTWAHTFKLAGKSVLIVSTCDSNGHTTVTDDLHIKMLRMGARVVGKYVGTNFIPNVLETDSYIVLLDNVQTDIPIYIPKTIKNWESKIVSNRFNESLFEEYKKHQILLLEKHQSTGETDYWVKSGMINCKNFQEYLEIIEEKLISNG